MAASAFLLAGCAADAGSGDPQQEKTAQESQKVYGGCIQAWGGSNALWHARSDGSCTDDPNVCNFESQVQSTVRAYGGWVPYEIGWMQGGDGNYYYGFYIGNVGGDTTNMTNALTNLANQYPWAPVQAQVTSYCSFMGYGAPWNALFITWDPRCPSCSNAF